MTQFARGAAYDPDCWRPRAIADGAACRPGSHDLDRGAQALDKALTALAACRECPVLAA